MVRLKYEILWFRELFQLTASEITDLRSQASSPVLRSQRWIPVPLICSLKRNLIKNMKLLLKYSRNQPKPHQRSRGTGATSGTTHWALLDWKSMSDIDCHPVCWKNCLLCGFFKFNFSKCFQNRFPLIFVCLEFFLWLTHSW